MSDRFDNKLKLKLESNADRGAGHVSAVRRIELITGATRRRRWSSDEKARVVLESLRLGANVSEVARRNGLSPQQLFAWRREAHALFQEGAAPADRPASATVRQPRLRKEQRMKPPEIGTDTAVFAPVALAASLPPSSPPSSSQPAPTNAGRIEVALGDTVVRILGEVETSVLVAVLRAVRRAS